MFALLLLTSAIICCDDPVVIDDDVEIALLPKFKAPIEILQSVRQELAAVNIHVSQDEGKTWNLHQILKPTDDEFGYRAEMDGMVWFTIQFVYKTGKKEPKDSSEFNPHKKVHFSLTEREVKKRHDLTEEAQKQFAEDLKNKSELRKGKSPRRENLPGRQRDQITQLEQDYGIQIVLDNPGFPIEHQGGYIIRGETASASAIEKFLSAFVEEWRHYPSSLIHKARLKKIIVGQNIELSTRDIERSNWLIREKSRYPIGGTTDATRGALFFSMISNRPAEQIDHYQRDLIHHELFHFLDARIRNDIDNDADWSSLNIADFRYGRLNSDRLNTNVTSRFPGFITPYSRSAIAEDKAETFSHMMLNLHEMECRAMDDEILAKKMSRIRKDLEGFSPALNDSFWNKIRYLDRPRLTQKGIEDPWALAHPTLPPLPKPGEATENKEPEWTITPEHSKHRLIFHRRRCRD